MTLSVFASFILGMVLLKYFPSKWPSLYHFG